MQISNIRVEELCQSYQLTADVKFETHWVWGDSPFQLWYRFPTSLSSNLSSKNGDPFFAAFLPVAMALGESLTIDAAVSRRLLSQANQIQEIYQSWDSKMQPVVIFAEEKERPVAGEKGAGKGLFFSLGGDSSYSLCRNVAANKLEDRITHLIPVEGFDVYLWESQRFIPMLEHIIELSKELDKVVLPVSTNLRDLTDRVVDWLRIYHGPALASVALAMGSKLSNVRIAATQTYELLLGSGSHPLLDPLWGTESLSFVHDGLEASRLEKLQFLAQHPRFIKHLRVCATGEVTDAYNCGYCEKCLRTMIGLHACNAIKFCETLPHSIDPRQIDNITLESPVAVTHLEELTRHLGKNQSDIVIRDALISRIEQYRLL